MTIRMVNKDGKSVLQIVYKSSPTVRAFRSSSAFYRAIRGPRGSGKSTGCCMEGMRRSRQQAPLWDGIRRTRGLVVRNSYRELMDTTVKTWLDWMPEDIYGKFNYSNMTHRIRYGDVEAEVLFRSADKPSDVKKFLSLEVTWAYVNEAREVPFSIIEGLADCVGRYPSARDGGATWSGVFMDSNSMDDDHWWPKTQRGNHKHWAFFDQPGGLYEDPKTGKFLPNPDAENIENLPGGYDYYLIRASGKTPNHIRVYYCNQFGFTIDGRPVLEEYLDHIHFDPQLLGPPSDFLPIGIGLDFGLTPAAAIGQLLPLSQVTLFDEVVTEGMGAEAFAHVLKAHLNANYAGRTVEIWGDPSGDDRAGTDESTVFQVLRANGIPAKPAPFPVCAPSGRYVDDPALRRDALASPMLRLVDGRPAFRIGPKAKKIRKGLAGGYCYRRIQVAGEDRYEDKPKKNAYSHPCEAAEYLAIGWGLGKELLVDSNKNPVHRPSRAQLDP